MQRSTSCFLFLFALLYCGSGNASPPVVSPGPAAGGDDLAAGPAGGSKGVAPARSRRLSARRNLSAAYPGDGGPATQAALNAPEGVTVDASGNVFIADTRDQLIRRVDASTGVISTIAGDGTACGFARSDCGDGGPATRAQLDQPVGVAVDAAGDVFIADSQNQKIRRVDANTGIISTVAGDGAACSSPGPASCGDGGPASAAQLSFPEGVAVDASGNLFIADTFDNRIRKVDSSGKISTVAGNGNSGFAGDNGPAAAAALSAPTAVAVDASGNLFIADTGNYRIRKVAGGTISTAAGTGDAGTLGDGGPATAAQFSYPQSLALDASGNLFIADSFANRIRRVDARTQLIGAVAGDGTLCASGANSCGDGGPARAAQLDEPSAVAVDASGAIFIADTEDNRIRRVDPKTAVITTIAGTGAPGPSA